jgi:hypothetical protein
MSASHTAALAWQRLGTVPPRDLTDARLQLHHAIQLIVSASISWLPHRPDDSHTSLTWNDEWAALQTEPVTASGGRYAMRPANLSLLWYPGGVAERPAFSLHGRTVPDALAWVRAQGVDAGLDPAAFTSRKHYEIPPHAVDRGGAFDGRAHAMFEEMERYWHDASIVLNAIAQREPGASDVRCWPHHFDIATLITLPPGRDGTARTIGVGHEPGDEWYSEPYWYVSPSPYPTETGVLPEVQGGGRWHTKQWVGAVLPASTYARDSAEIQKQRVETFASSAIAGARTLLGAL